MKAKVIKKWIAQHDDEENIYAQYMNDKDNKISKIFLHSNCDNYICFEDDYRQTKGTTADFSTDNMIVKCYETNRNIFDIKLNSGELEMLLIALEYYHEGFQGDLSTPNEYLNDYINLHKRLKGLKSDL